MEVYSGCTQGDEISVPAVEVMDIALHHALTKAGSQVGHTIMNNYKMSEEMFSRYIKGYYSPVSGARKN
jgi:hypothetical protein